MFTINDEIIFYKNFKCLKLSFINIKSVNLLNSLKSVIKTGKNNIAINYIVKETIYIYKDNYN